VPADVLTAGADGTTVVAEGEFLPSANPADPAAVQAAVALLGSAERPLLLGGPSCKWGPAGRHFQALLAASGLPGFVLESPRGLTDPALHGVGAEFRQADVVLLLAPQDFVAGFAAPRALAEGGRLIQVAPSVAELGPNRVADLNLIGDAPAVLSELTAAVAVDRAGWAVGAAGRVAWSAQLAARQRAGREALAAAEQSDQILLHPLRVCAEVRELLGPGDVVAIDGGEFAQWARWTFGGAPQRVVLNGKIGMIGCALPFALGARVAEPSCRVVAFLGDGTFGFHGFELDSAVRHKLPFVAIVGNDAAWAAERHNQLRLYGPDRVVASDLLETRYDQVARALGAQGELIEHPDQLRPALERALAADQPTVLNVRIASLPSPAAPAG
jgi:acetolactate synthase-1/2/3 large subunit